MLWGRSGNMCAFPDCKKILVVDETFTDDASVIGEEAHIVAQKKNGPRGISNLTLDQRDKYDNLILLCNIHHKVIDDQPNEYTVEKIKEFKLSHENWIKSNLISDIRKFKEDEIYASYIEKFVDFSHINSWTNWTSWILGATTTLPKDEFNSLKQLPNYIVSRIWPQRYPMLESSLINFKNIINDLVKVYSEYPSDREDCYGIEKFYKRFYRENIFNPDQYDYKKENEALEKYNYHIALIQDLVLELTRAGNYVCDFVREYIFEGFRIEEGALLITIGDFLGYKTYRVEYRGDERVDFPYKGLREFMKERENRDLHFGKGIEEDYFRKLPWE